MLERVETTLSTIRQKILNNEIIRKLLYNDSNNALNLSTPEIEEVKKYVTLRPIYQFENMGDYSQNSMINIYFTEIEPEDDIKEIIGTIRINVVVNIDKWELVNDKIRPIQIVNNIIEILNDSKFTISNPLELDSITELIISKQLIGYSILFNFVDGNSDINNF